MAATMKSWCQSQQWQEAVHMFYSVPLFASILASPRRTGLKGLGIGKISRKKGWFASGKATNIPCVLHKLYTSNG